MSLPSALAAALLLVSLSVPAFGQYWTVTIPPGHPHSGEYRCQDTQVSDMSTFWLEPSLQYKLQFVYMGYWGLNAWHLMDGMDSWMYVDMNLVSAWSPFAGGFSFYDDTGFGGDTVAPVWYSGAPDEPDESDPISNITVVSALTILVSVLGFTSGIIGGLLCVSVRF